MMRRLGIKFLMVAIATLISSCDVEGVKQGADGLVKEAEEIKKQMELSNLKDCKDEEGNPLPEWICKKGDALAKE